MGRCANPPYPDSTPPHPDNAHRVPTITEKPMQDAQHPGPAPGQQNHHHTRVIHQPQNAIDVNPASSRTPALNTHPG